MFATQMIEQLNGDVQVEDDNYEDFYQMIRYLYMAKVDDGYDRFEEPICKCPQKWTGKDCGVVHRLGSNDLEQQVAAAATEPLTLELPQPISQ